MVGAAAARPGHAVRFLGCLPLGLAAAAYAASSIQLTVPEPYVDTVPFRVSLLTLAGGVETGADRVQEGSRPVERSEPVEPPSVVERALPAEPPEPQPVQADAARVDAPVLAPAEPLEIVEAAFVVDPAPRKPAVRVAEPIAEPVETAMIDPARPPETLEGVDDAGPERRAADTDDGGHDASTVIREADYLHQVPPVYPRRAVELAQQGTVVIHAHVLADGTPGELRVAESSGFRLLDRAAVAAVEKWRFVPRADAGSAVADWVRVPVRFVIEN